MSTKIKPGTRVLLAGNPNSGKTSIFNALTGGRQRVGNYPGVTVEKRRGELRMNGDRFDVTDLPGTYSLTSVSPEERIAQEELLNANGGVVVTVADSGTLNRSLIFVSQIMLTGANTVLCLNMADEARKAGQRVDLARLEQLLGVPVVETVAHKGEGVDQLAAAIARAARTPARNGGLRLGDPLDSALGRIREALPADAFEEKSLTWVALKLLVGEPGYVDRVSGLGARKALEIAEAERLRIEADAGTDIAMVVGRTYHAFASKLLEDVVQQHPRPDARAVSDAVDRVLVHRIIGVPIFLAVMYGVFWLTFTVGEFPMRWIEQGFAHLSLWVSGPWPDGADSPLRSLIVDGVIGGVGGVIVFLPNIILLFVGLAILDDTGYMARVAFLADRMMHRLGLHGRSFIPLMTGFGCSVPGIMATRTLENERDRLATMMVLPLMSCGARLPIWMLLIPAFFAPHLRAPMLWLIYAVGIVLALALALVLRSTLLRGEKAPFVMELPPYRLPTLKSVIGKMTERSGIYLRKAGTVILGISVIMWFITSYPKQDVYSVDRGIAEKSIVVFTPPAAAGPADREAALDNARRSAPDGVEVMTRSEIEKIKLKEDLEYSIAGRMGRFIGPALAPLGYDWKLTTAMIGAFAAKEVFVAQMGIVYSLGEVDEQSQSLRDTLQAEYSTLVCLSLMLFLLIGTPCMSTVAITRRESGSWKWAMLQFFGLTGLAYVTALIVYQIGRFVV